MVPCLFGVKCRLLAGALVNPLPSQPFQLSLPHMFTGIIEGRGKLLEREKNIFTFSHPFEDVFEVGESVALSGMCATVLTSTKKEFTVEIIAESRRLTVYEDLEVGQEVNLERSAQIGQRNSGHNVQGHVDEVGKIINIEKQRDYWCVRVEYSEQNKELVVHKGSISLDGISLTISALSPLTASRSPLPWIEVSIIQHTWNETNLHNKKVGDKIHIEFDVFGKYVQRQKEV